MIKFLKTYIFDKHHGIERFGLLFIALTICLSLLTASIGVESFQKKHQQLTNQAMYTTAFTMSRSQVSGKVVGIYTDANHTKALLLLKFDDVSKISLDANNYTLFLRGWDLNKNELAPLQSNPSGAIYMLGNTGYMGIYLVDAAGFKNQVCYLSIRNDKELDNVSADNVNIDKIPNAQYAEYDLADIYFNMGATGTTVADCLSQDVLTVRDMYEECVVRAKEAEIRTLLDADLRSMRADLILISEYTQRLSSYDIAINAPMEAITGDYMVNGIINDDGSRNIVASMDPSVKVAAYTEGEPLYLMSDYVCKQGVDFDWYGSSVFKGYINALRGTKSAQEYVSGLMQLTKTDSTDTSLQIPDKQWYYRSSGADFSSVTDGGFSKTNSDIQTAINDLMGAWQTYLSHKTAYQCTDLMSLLELDYDVMTVDNNYTINNSADMLRVTR